MSKSRGYPNRHWTVEERLKYVQMHEKDHIPVWTIMREFNIPRSTLRGWIKRYREGGIEALNPKKLRAGNHFAALHRSKSLTENERLLLLVEKLQIENEPLLAENEKLEARARASESGKIKDRMERAKLESELHDMQRLVDRIPPDILAELKRQQRQYGKER